MSEEPKKQKRSRPKSEVVKSSVVDGGEKADKKKHSSRSKTAEDGEAKKSHSKKSHSHRSEKPVVEDRSAEIEQLKKDLEAANARVATLQQENETLASQTNQKKDHDSSSSSDNQNEQVATLKSQLEEKNNACAEHERALESLRNEISNLRAEHDKALEAEFEKLAAAQREIKSLQEKNEELQKPKPIQGVKVASQPSPTNNGNTNNVNTALSPRGQAAQGNIPAWKQRELEKQKEAEEARQAESRAKLQKVASLRVTKNDIHTESEYKNFKDPLDNKPSAHGGVLEKEDTGVVADSISPALELTEQEKVEAEMARLAKTLKRGGHNI